jgi:endoglucanase
MFGAFTVQLGPSVTDINGDGKVSILDLATVARRFGSRRREPGYDIRVDLDGNGVVNILDISRVARDFGKTV